MARPEQFTTSSPCPCGKGGLHLCDYIVWDWDATPDPIDTRTYGKRAEAKLYYCDNCGRRHWGRMVKCGDMWDYDWDFIWTDPKGNPKSGYPC